MGSFCGWTGKGLGPDASRQAIDSMLDESGRAAYAKSESRCDNIGGLAIREGLYATSFLEQDGIRTALVGSPRWDDKELADIAINLGPAASLIRAYRNFGTDLLSRLHGPFALAIQDGDQTIIAIDRLGIHRLSYAFQDGVFVFATSTGSVVRHPQISRRVDPQAIFNYFYFHDIPSPGTYFSGVEKLLPAQYIHLHNGRIRKEFYWQLSYNDHNQAPLETQQQRFHDIVRQAVAATSLDSPIATFLSGGTDSSTITGLLAEIRQNPVDAYSIGFGAEGFDEMEYARLAAKRYGATLHEYYLKPDDILEAIPIISSTYDEPFANDSAVPTWFCAKQAASDGIRVMLAGDGGDEVFGGNERYAKQMVFEHYGRLPESVRKHLIEPVASSFPYGDALLPVRKLKSYITQARMPLPERLESYNFVYRQSLDEMFEPEFLASVNPDIPKELLRDAYFRTDAKHPVSRMLHLDLKFTLADNDLRKVSRMCEAAGVEVRYPLLDEALVEFSGQLPAHYKVKGNRTRLFFKQALKDFLPREIITKTKHGFGLPFGVWALSHPPLKELVDNSLNKLEGRGYLRSAYIHKLQHQHANEHPTYFGKMIWVMVMLEQWLETHNES
jgi:asparagine synthase (glutamine-hydrolysing)